jgi:ornithine cyclodeaminase/alanine dehydrogenase-like protein (mu-crystallin family)
MSGARVGPERAARAIAAAGAVASRFLAVGAPRSFGIIVDGASDVAGAALSLAAHRTWFDPRDIRCASIPDGADGTDGTDSTDGADQLARATGGRTVRVAEALACDIVCVHASRLRIAPADLRRGSHVNAVSQQVLDDALAQVVTPVREADLPSIAAGLVDGRRADEITICVIGDAAIAATVV